MGQDFWDILTLNFVEECYELMTDILMKTSEPPHDKTNKMTVCTANSQISLGIFPV